jgi:hypothetical protein
MKTLIKFLSYLGVLLSIFILIMLAIFLLNKPILNSNAPEVVKDLVTAIIPPKDLYDCLIKEEIDISQKNLIKRIDFKNKYVGRHDIGILLDRFTNDLYFVPLSRRYKLKLKMEVNFYVNDIVVFSSVIENKYDPFIGRDKSGFSFITYDCPKDLPLNKLITCEVKIITPDAMLNTVHGPVRLYIEKTFDK